MRVLYIFLVYFIAQIPDLLTSALQMYTFQKEEDLAQVVRLHSLSLCLPLMSAKPLIQPQIEIIRPLRISMILENVPQLRYITQTIASSGKSRSHYFTGDGPIPPSIIHEAAASLAIGDCCWVYYGTAYGPENIRKYKLDIIDREFHRVPGCKRIDPSTLDPSEYFWVRDRVSAAEPDIQELTWVNWVPNGAHIAFSPVSPIRGTDAMALYQLAVRRHAENGIDFFPAFIVGLREMHLIVEIVFDNNDPAKRKAALACLRAMVDDAAQLGYGEYRTHLATMDQVAGTYNWGDGALMKFNEKLKDCLDPKGILAPGRCGVWPARYRGRGWEMTGPKNGEEGKEETSEGNGVGEIAEGNGIGNGTK